MCKQFVYHNYYLGGATDISERVEMCAPGNLCKNRQVIHIRNPVAHAPGRTSPLLPSLPRHAATFHYTTDPYVTPVATSTLPRSPPTPPGSRGFDSEGRRRMYFDANGKKIVEVRTERSPRRERSHREERRSTRLPHAPEPPAPRPAAAAVPMPIPIRRSATAPWGIDTPPHEQRGRRPIIVEERAPRERYRHAEAATPIEIVEHATSGRHRSRRREEGLLHPTHAHRRRGSGSPVGYGSAEDDTERHARRLRRREAKAAAAGMATSVPTQGNVDVFGTSPTGTYSSYGSSPVVDPSPAVSAVKKELRWEDEQRAAQNARIRERPKLDRAATGTGVQGEVRGILKNSPSASAGVSPVLQPSSPSPRRSLTRDDAEMEGLYRGLEGLGISSADDGRETSAERRSRSRAAEEQDSAAMMERLRGRFSMPPRRYTAGTGARKRTEVWYPDGGRRYERYP